MREEAIVSVDAVPSLRVTFTQFQLALRWGLRHCLVVQYHRAHWSKSIIIITFQAGQIKPSVSIGVFIAGLPEHPHVPFYCKLALYFLKNSEVSFAGSLFAEIKLIGSFRARRGQDDRGVRLGRVWIRLFVSLGRKEGGRAKSGPWWRGRSGLNLTDI